jgi:hypothetical protein
MLRPLAALALLAAALFGAMAGPAASNTALRADKAAASEAIPDHIADMMVRWW